MELYFPNNFTRWMEQEQINYQDGKEKTLFQHLYPRLEWNTLLRLRLLCKGTKKLVDKYIREGDGFKRCPEIKIYQRPEREPRAEMAAAMSMTFPPEHKERHMAAFLRMNLPTTAIRLVNFTGDEYFDGERDSIEAFVRNEMLSKKIAHLRVHRMSLDLQGMEEKFFTSLENLESLEMNELGMNFPEEVPNQKPKVVAMYKRLKKLVLGSMEPRAFPPNLFIGSDTLMKLCPNLEYAGDAFTTVVPKNGTPVVDQTVLGKAFGMIQKRVEESSSKLRSYDFAGFFQDPNAQNKGLCLLNSVAFAKLLMACQERGIKLYNVNAGWLSHGKVPWDQLTSSIISMVNVHGFAVSRLVKDDSFETMPVLMPNLEKLEIPLTSQSCLLPGVVNRMVWPKLRVLEVTVNSTMLDTLVMGMYPNKVRGQLNCIDAESTANLCKWLFMDMARPTLVELSLEYVECVQFDPVSKNAVGRLGTCCPNLRKLKLVGWPGLGDLLKRALGEFRHLEELTLDRCERVRDDTFPLNSLQNLKKLSLLRLEQMPGITEALFRNVLPNLQNLTDISVSSARAVKPRKVFRIRK